uniref:hypothetical protein n=1 Tax=Altererythrobacter segetis TaxID=1104773 RepID=UPI001409A757|nr:hypothetical protein [Altererythrobacter segetis]
MKSILGGVAVLAALSAAPVLAQSATVASPVIAAAPMAIAAPVTNNAVLRSGTELPLRLLEELTTKGKKLRVGNRFHLETSEPLLVNGVTVIPVGSPAVGEITDVRNKGMWGKSGHLNARLLYVTVNGRQIRLSGAFDDKGKAGGVGAVAVSAVVFLPAGFFMTGTSAKIPQGTVVRAFIDEDVPLAIPAQAAPLAVGVPSAAQPVSATTVPANAAIKAVALAPADAVASGAQARCWKENKC